MGAQANGCSPIVRLVESGGGADRAGRPEHDRALDRDRQSRGRPVSPRTRSGRPAAGSPACPTRTSSTGIKTLAETSGIFTETAGGATVAGAFALARSGRLGPDDEVVLCITGNGLKTVEALAGALPEAPIIAPRLRELEALHGRDL